MDEFATLVYTEIRVREKDYKQAFERTNLVYMAESEVHRRQILTNENGPHAERVSILMLVVDP